MGKQNSAITNNERAPKHSHYPKMFSYKAISFHAHTYTSSTLICVGAFNALSVAHTTTLAE